MFRLATVTFLLFLLIALESAAPRTLNILSSDISAMQFVPISPGSFMMGCPTSPYDGGCSAAELPAHLVTITKKFELGKFEVTQAQWQAVTGYGRVKGEFLPALPSFGDIEPYFIKVLNARNDGYRYRLPTEAEWEYAARAGTTEKYPGRLEQIAWYGAKTCFFSDAVQVGHPSEFDTFKCPEVPLNNQIHPVGTKQANAWGLHDMIGNAWEWTSDFYGEYSSMPQTDPKGPASGGAHVMRGGAWNSDSFSMRVSYRTPGAGRIMGPPVDVGFRIVRESN